MGFLINDLFQSRSQLHQISRVHLLNDSGKRATALGYFFSERSNDLLDLSENRELSAYFENRALGMSMEYGLASSLAELNTSFDKFRGKKKLGNSEIYKRIVFLDVNGRKLVDSRDPSLRLTQGNEGGVPSLTFRKKNRPMFFISGEGNRMSIIIAMPYRFKGQYVGSIQAWFDPEEIYGHFLSVVDPHHYPMLIMFEDRYVSSSRNIALLITSESGRTLAAINDGETGQVTFRDQSGKLLEMAAYRTAIQSTPFSMVTLIPLESVNSSSPRQLVATITAIGLLILSGSLVIIRSRTRNTVLNVRLEEAGIRAQEAAEQNMLLQEANLVTEEALQAAEDARDTAEASERARTESEERLQVVLDGSNDGFWDWDIPSGRMTINNRWAEMLGYIFDEIEPSVDSAFKLIHPDDLAVVRETLARHLSGDTQFYEIDYRMRIKSGGWKWIQSRGKTVARDADGRALRAAGTHTDITDRKETNELLYRQTVALEHEIAERQQAQELLALKQEQLKLLNLSLQKRVDEAISELRQKDQVLISQGRQAAMGEMIGNIAHQWRQPLNALSMLIGNLQFVCQTNELTQEYMEKSADTANRLIQKMSTTINDFRNFFSPNKDMVAFSATEQLRQTIELIEAAFKHQNVELSIEVKCSCLLKGYPNEFSHVLLNLLNNAKDAVIESKTEPKRVDVLLSEKDGMGIFTVRDTGDGIPDAALDKIFEPYFSTKHMGTGIGLYMCKMIIERNMFGLISAKNVDGGAEFTVSVPVAENM